MYGHLRSPCSRRQRQGTPAKAAVAVHAIMRWDPVGSLCRLHDSERRPHVSGNATKKHMLSVAALNCGIKYAQFIYTLHSEPYICPPMTGATRSSAGCSRGRGGSYEERGASYSFGRDSGAAAGRRARPDGCGVVRVYGLG